MSQKNMKSAKMGVEFSAIILAAGASSRMKSSKFCMPYSSEMTFIQHITSVIAQAGSKRIIAILNKDGIELLRKNNHHFIDIVSVALNPHPEYGRFYSLMTGIRELACNSPVLIHNVDNPFITVDTIKTLLSLTGKADYSYPVYKGKGGHPLLISGMIAKKLLNESVHLNHNPDHYLNLTLKEYLKQFTGKPVEVDDEKVLVNINTPEDYRKYF